MNQHTTRIFDADLQTLVQKIGEMGSVAEKQIARAVEALQKRDAVLAEQVIATEDQIDALQREVEDKAVVTIARRQPVAVDLRNLVAALRIAIDLEHIGDHAESIAKEAALLTDRTPPREVLVHLELMAQLVRDQLTQVLQSYQNRDVAMALEVWRKDQDVDALNNSIFRELLTYMLEDAHNISYCTQLLFCAKNLERIGDHTTNIAETVYYMVRGQPLSEERPKADITSTLVPSR
jgi:phosphate transport system protein